jgi:hypothetical protein
LGKAHVTWQEVSGPFVGSDSVQCHTPESSGLARRGAAFVAASDPDEEERGSRVGRHELRAARSSGDRPEPEDGDGAPPAFLQDGRSHSP